MCEHKVSVPSWRGHWVYSPAALVAVVGRFCRCHSIQRPQRSYKNKQKSHIGSTCWPSVHTHTHTHVCAPHKLSSHLSKLSLVSGTIKWPHNQQFVSYTATDNKNPWELFLMCPFPTMAIRGIVLYIKGCAVFLDGQYKNMFITGHATLHPPEEQIKSKNTPS